MKKLLFLLFLTAVIGACGTPAFFLRDVNQNLSHSMAVANFDTSKGQHVFWGGTILSGKNLKNTTELVILAYPLNNYGEPLKDTSSYGRFVAVFQGYLELGEYAKDRRVTMVGQLTALRKGKVGERKYTYPVLNIRQTRIWIDEPDVLYDDSHIRFHFGVGVYRHHHW